MIFQGKKRSKQALLQLLASFNIREAERELRTLRILRWTSSTGPR